jgi:hypothetical protein
MQLSWIEQGNVGLHEPKAMGPPPPPVAQIEAWASALGALRPQHGLVFAG